MCASLTPPPLHSAALCNRDTSTTRYDLSGLVETDLSVGRFNVSGATCVAGYSGAVTYTPCAIADGSGVNYGATALPWGVDVCYRLNRFWRLSISAISASPSIFHGL